MFIIEFFKTFKEAYRIYNKDKLHAKRQYKRLQELHTYYSNIVKLFNDASRIIYRSLIIPTKTGYGREEFSAFDSFLLFGHKIDGIDEVGRIGRGYVHEIDNMHLSVLQNSMKHMKEHIKKYEYDKVNYWFVHYVNSCKDFDDIYGTNTEELTRLDIKFNEKYK